MTARQMVRMCAYCATAVFAYVLFCVAVSAACNGVQIAITGRLLP